LRQSTRTDVQVGALEGRLDAPPVSDAGRDGQPIRCVDRFNPPSEAVARHHWRRL